MDQLDSKEVILSKKILNGLNSQQFEAVTSPSNVRLQIIAGPGTGKTKVLISRVAYLIIECGIKPERIVVTTFTKRAANEMMERLREVLKNTGVDINKLLIGTFHSICYRVLRVYGHKIGVDAYKIADERDSNQILQNVLSDLSPEDLDMLGSIAEDEINVLKSNQSEMGKNHGFEYKRIKRHISKLKSSGLSVDGFSKAVSHNKALLLIYEKYQEQLAKDRLLDFDDCLLLCHKLVVEHPVLNFVEHVLVDEFQDTNEIQLRLMYEFARGSDKTSLHQHNITIVGDPDQSIYAFRDAQSINFEKMKSHYQAIQLPCKIIILKENYRSTNGILELSEKIMRQQSNRVPKDLKSQIPRSVSPVFHQLDSAEKEALWIAYQIEHIVALPDTPFKFSDISILVRSSSQTRIIENTFMRRRIPHFMVRGKVFWERKEVVSMIDYLRIIVNPNDRIAYLRTLNFPKRGLGEKTISQIDTLFTNDQKSESIYNKLHSIAKPETISVKLATKARENLLNHLKFIASAKELLHNIDQSILSNNGGKQDSITEFFEFVYTKSGLQKEFSNEPNCELNIMEIQKQLCEFTPMDESIPVYEGGSEEELSEDTRCFVEKFVHSIGLYETDSSDELSRSSSGTADSLRDRGKVALSTIHGSKGLEWSIVFVPGLSEGLLPAAYSIEKGGEEAVDEERRCFYVATTRAKHLLYISSYVESESRASWSYRPVENISRYVSSFASLPFVSLKGLSFEDKSVVDSLYRMRQKEYPKSSKFNLSTFKTLYVDRLDAFLNGDDFSIQTQDFEKSIEEFKSFAPNPFKCAKYVMGQSATVQLNGFDSAARLQKVAAQKQQKQNKSSQSKDITDLLGCSRSVGLKKFKPTENPEKKKTANKAPEYVRPVMQPQNIPAKSAANKAPPYIPVRQVPKAILERRKKLGQS